MKLGSAEGNLWEVGESEVVLARPVKTARPVKIAARPKTITVDLSTSAMIVVDMQNRFCRVSREEFGDLPTAKPIAPLQRLLPVLRGADVPVIWVNWGNRPDKLNMAPGLMHGWARGGGFRPELMDKGSWEAEIVAGLDVGADDIHVDKYRVSGFPDSPLESILKNLRVTTLFFGGVNLDQCVYATMLEASFLGYDIVLVEDCAATRSPEYCTQATLYNTERGMGFITQADAVVAGIG